MQLHSPTAREYESKGNVFDPQLHLVEPSWDTWAMDWLEKLIAKYDPFVEAHSLYHDERSGVVSLDLQFSSDDQGKAMCMRCLKESRKGPPQRPRGKVDGPRLHRRLFNGRFYRLPDGRAFYLLGKWDHHGNRLGKVQAGPPLPDGMIPVANVIVHEDVLRRCPLVEAHDAPFAMKT